MSRLIQAYTAGSPTARLISLPSPLLLSLCSSHTEALALQGKWMSAVAAGLNVLPRYLHAHSVAAVRSLLQIYLWTTVLSSQESSPASFLFTELPPLSASLYNGFICLFIVCCLYCSINFWGQKLLFCLLLYSQWLAHNRYPKSICWVA